ncbi:hypothetical protein O1611_g8359 [Lasiodiplodia mahajangana]|uniref:Uncharacterized protein n=1 Tax=Lasiodiplodia mahajangana TaxID=1108764 RepID=A0ACC2JCS6_9PEZI|nr:hypothetical protein O1611_g8359 [Lasiodiplodia mahajangana]
MFTSRPPVKTEVDEQKRADVLRASAIAMAKKMYDQQQKMIDAKRTHTDQVPPRGNLEVSSSISDDQQPAQLTTLQDAAYKQAQARLAKMQQKNAQNRDLQDYYGTKPLSHRFSVKGKLRKRSFSDGAVIEDQRRSQQIRTQMSLFSNRLSEIDENKRQHDQDLLLATAQRNVHEQLKGIDAKIATETGMVPPPTLTQWELKARAVAQSRALQQDNRGKVDIGAGVQIDQEEINAIAARRVQPILDEINAKAELEHTRQLELRMEVERKREEQEAEKARQREIQDIQKKLKLQEKLEQKERKAEGKQEAKAKKEEDKVAKAEQKKLTRAGRTKSAEHEYGTRDEPELDDNIITMNSSGQPVRVPRLGSQETRSRSNSEVVEDAPKSPPAKVKLWLKSRFSRGLKPSAEEQTKDQASHRRFVGGASLTGARSNVSVASLDSHSASMREVAMAGRTRSSSSGQAQLEGDPDAVSQLSVESDDEVFRDGMADQPTTRLTPPRRLRDNSPAQTRSPARDSRFHEIM